MNKYLRKNGKKIMAVLGILLMIAFALPSATSTFRRNESPVGTIDNGKVTLGAREYNAYRSQWQGLKRQFGGAALSAVLAGLDRIDENQLIRILGDARMSEMLGQLDMIRQQNPMYFFQLAQQQPELFALSNLVREGSAIFAQIDNNDDQFLLLVKEAQLMGVGVNPDLVEAILAARGITKEADPDHDFIQQALRSLLMVNNAAGRAASIVKVSRPEVVNLLASQQQKISVNLIEFSAKDFLDKLPAPTPEQLAAQFNKYKDKEAGQGMMDFGYKYPNRVKYDAIWVGKEEVKKGAGPIEEDQIWEHYLRNKSTFFKDKPASTAPSDALNIDRGPTTMPMTFEEAREKIVNRLTNERVEALADKIRDAIKATMKADYDAYKAAVAGKTTTAPAPASSLGVPYNSYDYLQKLRDKIQADFKVTITIEREEGWQTEKSLEDSKLGKESFMTDARVALPKYLTRGVEAFLSEDERKSMALTARADNKPVATWEPTPVFRDIKDDLLIARVTAADPSHVPASLDEVKEKVAAHVKMAAAFDRAKQAAQATLDRAKSKQWLQTIANEEGKSVITTGLFTASEGGRSAVPVTGYDLKGEALSSFVDGAFKLLALPPRSGEAPRPPSAAPTTQPTTKPATQAATKPASKTVAKATTRPAATAPQATTRPATSAPIITAFKDHPVGLIELPADAKVVVAEVDRIKPAWTKDRQAAWDTAVANQERASTEQVMRQQWFSYDRLVARLGFVPAEKRDRKPQPRQNLPLNPFTGTAVP